jgi:hypothetical protein
VVPVPIAETCGRWVDIGNVARSCVPAVMMLRTQSAVSQRGHVLGFVQS